MPRKKLNRSKSVSQANNSSIRRLSLSSVNFGESYVSLFLGAFVVVIIAVLLFFVINGKRIQNQQMNNSVREKLQQQLDEQMRKDQGTLMPDSNAQAEPIKGNSYTISEGDTLWDIAMRKYNDGTKWTSIMIANKISDSNVISQGTKISLPDKFNIKTYTVKDGDSLWSIAVSTYGDGYRWTDIAKANGIQNPNRINTGSVLSLP